MNRISDMLPPDACDDGYLEYALEVAARRLCEWQQQHGVPVNRLALAVVESADRWEAVRQAVAECPEHLYAGTP